MGIIPFRNSKMKNFFYVEMGIEEKVSREDDKVVHICPYQTIITYFQGVSTIWPALLSVSG
jgi:hypothetical protein